MKKASVILDSYGKELENQPLTDHQYHFMKLAIVEARSEAIKEAASVAVARLNDDYEYDVDKDSILSLLKENV